MEEIAMNNNGNTNTGQTRQLYPRIVSKPGILYGKPVIEGTRLSVEVLLQNLPVAIPVTICSMPTLSWHLKILLPQLSTLHGSLPILLTSQMIKSAPSHDVSSRCEH